MSDFYVEKLVKARKQHKCIWCDSVIIVGETYIRCGGVFEGNFGMRKECVKCHDNINEFISEGADFGDGIENLYEYWKEFRCYKCIRWNEEHWECNSRDGMTYHNRCENFKMKEVTK
jgi:hypothetical protein